METPREWWVRLRHLWRRSEAEREMEEEIRFHLEKEAERNERTGMTPEAARRAARVTFGGVERVREEARDEVRPRLLEDAWQDARYAVRGLRKSPGFAAVAVLTLGLGIGANTAVFSAVSGVLLRPLPFADPDRLWMLWEENVEKGWHMNVAAPANYLDWREGVPAFEDAAAYSEWVPRSTVTGAGEPRVMGMGTVTGNLFSVLGAGAAVGRTLRDEETWEGRHRVMVLSHDAWMREFAGDPSVLGTTLRVDGRPYEVVGVMEEGFSFPSDDADFWIPWGWNPADRSETWFRRAHFARVVARLKPGVDADAANAQLQSVVLRLQRDFPETNRVMGAGMTPLHDFLVGETRTPLLVVFGAVGLLLLLACANVGNLLLVKAASRQREVSVRSALGAGRARLVRQMVTESLVLSTAGGAVGLGLGIGGTRLLERLRPDALLGDGSIGADGRVLAFTAAVSVASGLLFGVAPALWRASSDVAAGLRAGGRTGGLGRGARRGTQGLVVLEVALAVLLVVGAGLLVRSFDRLRRVDPGFDPRDLLAVQLYIPGAEYDTPEKSLAFYTELVRRVNALPGVSAVSAVSRLPLTESGWTSDFAVEGWAPGQYGTEVVHREVMPDYFRTMRVPVLRGRAFSETDSPGAGSVVVINESFARRFFSGEDPVGRRISFDRVPDESSIWRTIVGVVGDELQVSPAQPPRIEVFAPVAQDPTNGLTLVARTHASPLRLLPAVEREISALDPDVVPLRVRTMEAVRAESVARERFLMALLGGFAGIALILAMVGVYGVISQMVRQQSREIGVRLALGARPAAVMGGVVRGGLALMAAGVGIGTLGALFATRAMRTLLYGTAPTDPTTLAAVALLLLLAGVAAAAIPARRASRTDPAVVLRE